jgi:DNA-binding response OmpR family regulator
MDYLTQAGFRPRHINNGIEAVEAIRKEAPDLVLLDVMLPGADGWSVLQAIREQNKHMPVFFLSARDEVADRVKGLELGADDYIAKPFSPLELVSRGRAILRRARREQLAARSVRAVGSLQIDLPRHEVVLGERSVDVTASEFRVLALLAGNPGTVFTRRQIMEHVWEGPYFGDGHPVDTHVLNLRRKIEADPTRPRRLLTVRGVGFKLVAPACEAV